jgi:hypothetical protein
MEENVVYRQQLITQQLNPTIKDQQKTDTTSIYPPAISCNVKTNPIQLLQHMKTEGTKSPNK